MDSLITDLLGITGYALDNQRGDATGMRASLQCLHRCLLDAAQKAPTALADVEVWNGGLVTLRVNPD